jgi:hypothetical protein
MAASNACVRSSRRARTACVRSLREQGWDRGGEVGECLRKCRMLQSVEQPRGLRGRGRGGASGQEERQLSGAGHSPESTEITRVSGDWPGEEVTG